MWTHSFTTRAARLLWRLSGRSMPGPGAPEPRCAPGQTGAREYPGARWCDQVERAAIARGAGVASRMDAG